MTDRMNTKTVRFTVNIPETATPFGDALIHQRMRDTVERPPASKLLDIKILGKSRDPGSRDYVITGDLTFGRWFPYN